MTLETVRSCVSIIAAVCLFACTVPEVHAQRDELQVEVVQEKSDADTDLTQVKKIRESLATRVNLRFKAATLEQIAEVLREEFQIPIRVDNDVIRSLGFDPNVEFDVKFSNVALSEGLSSFMLNAGLGYAVSGSSLVFTTNQMAQLSKSTQLYDVSDIIEKSNSKRVSVVVTGDQANSPVLNDIELTLRKQLAINAWNNGFEVRLLEKGNMPQVAVSGNEMQHEQVRVYLRQLRSARKDEAESDSGGEQVDGGDKNETRVYLISIKNGVEAEEYAQLVLTVFAEQFSTEKGHDVKAIAGTLVVTNNGSQHKRIQQFLKDMQLLPTSSNSVPNQPTYIFPAGGGFGGMGGGAMGGGGFTIPPPMAPLAPPR